MTNLLPPHAKKQIIHEYWVRVVCVWVIVWSVSLLVGSIVLWPTYVLLSGNNEAYAAATTQATERSNEYKELSAVLVQSSKQAEQIVAQANRQKMSSVLADVWTATGAGIDVESVSVSSLEGNIAGVNVTGQARDRQSLAGFRDRLDALPYVSEVNLPIDNLAQNEDIDFSLTVTIINVSS